jgi:protein-S-isoprenylcysteine O-methyltransferase Ste14
MPLREEFERQGNWLFRRRGFLPLLGGPLFALAFHRFSYPWGNHTLDLIWEMLCLGVSVMGLSIRVYVAGCTPKRTSGRNTVKGQMADSVNTSGMYSLVRHPLYLGNFLVVLGSVMVFHLWWFVFLYVLLFWLYYERIMFAEEESLRGKFGDAYFEWSRRTPTFLPNFPSWRPPALPFSYRTAVKREYQTLFLIVVLFTVIEVIGDEVVKDGLVVDSVWLTLFSIALIFFVVVRTIRKKTKVLHAQGR